MTTFTAKSDQSPLIAILVYPNVKLLDISGPLQVFTDAEQARQPAYRTCLVSLNGGMVITDTGVSVTTVKLSSVQPHTLLIAGGKGIHAASNNSELISIIQSAATRINRIGSVCTGAFLLAATGLCAGKRIATHWQACQGLAEKFPELQVDENAVYVNDGIWSSAGVTAGIDMALAMVSEDLHRTEALRLARSLVTYMVRPGDQAQFSVPLSLQDRDSQGKFDTLHGWIRQNLKNDLNVERLAARMHMSLRSFHRHYSQHCGCSPAKAITRIRLEAARDMLLNTQYSIERVASECGFTSLKQFQRTFRDRFNTTPSHYRAGFS